LITMQGSFLRLAYKVACIFIVPQSNKLWVAKDVTAGPFGVLDFDDGVGFQPHVVVHFVGCDNLDIPDTDATQIVNGICAATGWTAGSGKTKGVWAKERLVLWVKDTAKRGLLRESQVSISGTIDPVVIT
jgi:hypothetical protein